MTSVDLPELRDALFCSVQEVAHFCSLTLPCYDLSVEVSDRRAMVESPSDSADEVVQDS